MAKRVPKRTCIACQRVAGKLELVRLVCTPAGSIEIDAGGRSAGRGAYLCRRWGCWEVGLKGSRLERALRTAIGEDTRRRLISRGEEVIPTASSES